MGAVNPPSGISRGIVLVLLAVTAIWGVQFTLGKLVVTCVPATTLAFARSSLAAIPFVLLALSRPGGLRVSRADLPAFVFLALVGSSIYHISFFAGLQFAPAADGALLLPTMNPVFTVLVAWMLGRESATSRQVVGMVVSGVGVAVIFASVALEAPLPGASEHRLIGEGLYLLSSLAWGIYSAFGRPYFTRYGAARATALTTLLGLPPMALASVLLGDTAALLRMGPSEVVMLLFLAFLGAFVAFVVFNTILARIGAGAASRFTNLVPVWGLVVAMLVLGERPSPGQIAGAVLIVAGVWISTTRGRAPADAAS